MTDGPGPDDSAHRFRAGRDVILGGVGALVAVALLVWLIPAQVSREATGNDVAPAFIPQLSAWLVLGLSLLMIGHRLAAERPAWGSGLSRQFAGEIVLLSVAGGVTWLSLSYLGFLPTAAGVILAGGLLARQRPYWWMLPLALIFPVLVDYGAWEIFYVDLP